MTTDPIPTDDLDELRRMRDIASQVSTHFDGCWKIHWKCAASRLLDEVDRLRVDIATLEHNANQLARHPAPQEKPK